MLRGEYRFRRRFRRNTRPFPRLHRAWELELTVEAGMTPTQALTAATVTSADFLRLADRGTLDAGMSADFIVLDANPLDDIANTKRITDVYLRGRKLDRQAMRAAWN